MKIKEKFNKKILFGICISLLAVVLCIFVYTGMDYGNQAKNALYLSAEFVGEYKIADGPWQPYIEGEHVPANKGDVTLKGHFQLFFPPTGEIIGKAGDGTVIAFYFNHLNAEVSENGVDFRPFDAEYNFAGEDMCGKVFIGYVCTDAEEITLRLTNPHKFGNAYAVDDFFKNLSTYGGTAFERDVLNSGNVQRSFGIILVLFAFMVLGTAVFSMLIHVKEYGKLWLSGFCILFAGLYFIFNAHGVMFFSEIIKFNTRVSVGTIMLYMLVITAFIAFQLKDRAEKIGKSLVAFDLVSICLFMLAPPVFGIRFYDTLPVWAVLQCAICLVMTAILAIRYIKSGKKEKVLCLLGMLPMVAFCLDVFGEAFAIWHGGVVSELTFVLLFAASFILLLRVVPQNLNAARRASELEAERVILNAELAESRIAILISQIQPHFIYNTLGTIEQLCITEPEAASKLVRNFSLYLRGNFSELDNAKPIRFSREMNHVKHYTDIEQVRFPDMTIQYDLRSEDFLLPALSVQPLVENAIKHGLMGLEEGGIVTITAYETEEHYVVEVTDDGVGFDTSADYDESKHVGIKNIRGRIEAMCNGTLTIESEIGNGTKATIKIPKEEKENDSNNG